MNTFSFIKDRTVNCFTFFSILKPKVPNDDKRIDEVNKVDITNHLNHLFN